MGVVFLARDTKLDRDVAIKSLPPDFADDRDRLARFQREAKLLASLNHPNIATVHGLEEVDGAHYLVLEFVEGETLEQILERGPMPVSEALPVAKQIAEAIEAAHDKGVIHRDLKPANIKFTASDQVKVLDFGLAKAFEDPTTISGMASSPTVMQTHTPTMPGIILGTAGYLSPEQARGRTVDKRSDVWSFGCVLYEMLTGARLFPGETVTDSIGATLHRDPDWSLLPVETPPTIHLLLRRCLSKDRKRRLHDIADARVEIEEAISDPTSSSLNLASAALAVAGPRRRSLSMAAIGVGVIGVGVGAIGLWKPWSAPPESPEPMHLSITAPEGLEFESWDLSPDGLAIAFCGKSEDRDAKHPLFIRRLDRPEARAIPGANGGHDPVFSPDGQWIAFTRDDSVFRVRLDGGPPVEIAKLEQSMRWAGVWLNDHELLVHMTDTELARLNVSDGSIEPIERKDLPSDLVFTYAAMAIPSADALLTADLSVGSGTISRQLRALSLETGLSTNLIDDISWAGIAASSHLLFSRDGSLLGARFDSDRLEIVGAVTPLLAGIEWFTLCEAGTLVHGGQLDFGNRSVDIVVVSEVTGEPTVISQQPRPYQDFVLSADGRRIAAGLFTLDDDLPRIWMIDRDTGIEQPISPADRGALAAVWSPDGTRIAYAVLGAQTHSIEVIPIDGSAEPTTVVEVDATQERIFPVAWPASGSVLLAGRQMTQSEDNDVVLVSLDDGSVRPILATDASERPRALSPDGQLLVYTSDVSGDTQTYLQEIDLEEGTLGMRRLLPADHGFSRGRWSANGASLLGLDTDGKIWSVDISMDPELQISTPVELLDTGSIVGLESNSWAPSPDGEGYLFLRGEEEEQKFTQLNVVLNFQTLLDRQLPRESR